MINTQGQPPASARFKLHSERMGPLPVVNHFIERIGLEDLQARYNAPFTPWFLRRNEIWLAVR